MKRTGEEVNLDDRDVKRRVTFGQQEGNPNFGGYVYYPPHTTQLPQQVQGVQPLQQPQQPQPSQQFQQPYQENFNDEISEDEQIDDFQIPHMEHNFGKDHDVMFIFSQTGCDFDTIDEYLEENNAIETIIGILSDYEDIELSGNSKMLLCLQYANSGSGYEATFGTIYEEDIVAIYECTGITDRNVIIKALKQSPNVADAIDTLIMCCQ